MVYTVYSGGNGRNQKLHQGVINSKSKNQGDDHAYLSMDTLESPCGRSWGITSPHLHGGLLILMLLSFR